MNLLVLDSNGKAVVKYEYDAWGNHKVTASEGNEELANLNPFRYRSYYYDEETKLYYLKSRYYDPEVGRFISQDNVAYADPDSINGLNLYAYCLNNPVMYIDPNGNFVISLGVALSVGLFALFSLAVIELSFHPIENAINDFSNWAGSLSFDTGNNVYDSVNEVSNYAEIELPNVFYKKNKEAYKPKRPGARVQGKSKKDAYEKAKKRGGGKKPRFHSASNRGDSKAKGNGRQGCCSHSREQSTQNLHRQSICGILGKDKSSQRTNSPWERANCP